MHKVLLKSDLISIQFGLAEGLDPNLLECDDDKANEHVEEDEGHGAHVEQKEDEGIGRGAGSWAHWLIAVLEQLRVVAIVHHTVWRRGTMYYRTHAVHELKLPYCHY